MQIQPNLANNRKTCKNTCQTKRSVHAHLGSKDKCQAVVCGIRTVMYELGSDPGQKPTDMVYIAADRGCLVYAITGTPTAARSNCWMLIIS